MDAMSPQIQTVATEVAARTGPRRAQARGLILRLAFWGLVLTLIGLNAWWIWDRQPPVEMKTINAWLASGRLDDAERALRVQMRRSRHDGEARMKLARLLGQRGDYLGCAELLHQVPYWWPRKAEALFLEGQAYKLVDRARDAEAAWKACIAADPLHPVPSTYFRGAARELIAFYVLESRLDEARQTVWKAYDEASPPEHAGVLAMRMRAELERISHEEAVTKLRRYVSVTPDDWEARRALAREEQQTGHEDAAERNIKACLKAQPANPDVWRTWLEILQHRGDLDTLKTAVSGLPAAADLDAEIWKYRGLARELAADLPGAQLAYRRAIELKPYEATYYYKLGLIEQRLGHPEEARNHTRQSQQLNQAYSELHNAYINYLDTAQRAKPADPDYSAAVNRLAKLCEQLGWKREADAWRGLLSQG
jgi:tetratricopeptide (TPR) repeat protein